MVARAKEPTATRGPKRAGATPDVQPQQGPTNAQLDPNGPEADQPGDPLDFDTLPLSALRKYRTAHRLQVPSALSWPGYMVHGGIGKKTSSYKASTRVPKEELAAAVKKHFLNHNVRESDAIVDFIYSIKKQDEEFKLQFNP
uniref:ARAD1D38170p n=1 Tax=Blastobotrys adeninivorans TaxID=409370 RepID=A0A060THF2_BLAAD